MKITSRKLQVKTDERGNLVEVFRPEDVNDSIKGQFFVTTALPGKTKGNHYHTHKTEWYCVIQGEGRITIIENDSLKQHVINANGTKPQTVEIPPKTYHYIENVGKKELILLVYVDEVFNPKDPDTFYEKPKGL